MSGTSILAAIFAASFVQGIVRRSDVPDCKYMTNRSDYPEIVYYFNPEFDCLGTMVSKRHFITPAHCYTQPCLFKGFTVPVNGVNKTAVATHYNPDCVFNYEEDGPNDCDVLIVELDSDADVEPTPVYQWKDEVGKHFDMVGPGVAADAGSITKDVCTNGVGEQGRPKGESNLIFRRGQNVVKKVAEHGAGGIIYYDMSTNDDAAALPLEAVCAWGDGGSPMYLEGPDGKMYVAGQSSGPSGSEHIHSNPCEYGVEDQYVRLSSHYSWIKSVIEGAEPKYVIEGPQPVGRQK